MKIKKLYIIGYGIVILLSTNCSGDKINGMHDHNQCRLNNKHECTFLKDCAGTQNVYPTKICHTSYIPPEKTKICMIINIDVPLISLIPLLPLKVLPRLQNNPTYIFYNRLSYVIKYESTD